MVQLDALSRRPYLCPDEDKDNEDIVMLPDSMFLNLIDTTLQEKIANSNDLDQQAIDALKLLLKNTLTTPTPLKNNPQDWTFTKENGLRFLFYKNKTYVPCNTELQWEIYRTFMITKQQDTPENQELTMPFDNITGGLECAPSPRIMFKAVECVNNSKLIDHQQNQAIYLPKD